MTPRLSGLQKDVLSLYRRVLREAAKKDRASLADKTASTKTRFLALLFPGKQTTTSTGYAASEFRRQAATASRSDIKKIEYMIRKGEKQVKLLQMPGVKVVGGASARALMGFARNRP